MTYQRGVGTKKERGGKGRIGREKLNNSFSFKIEFLQLAPNSLCSNLSKATGRTKKKKTKRTFIPKTGTSKG